MKILSTFLLGSTLAIGAVVGLAPASQAAPMKLSPVGPGVSIPPPPTVVTLPPIDPCKIKRCIPPVKIDPCILKPALCKPPKPGDPKPEDPKPEDPKPQDPPHVDTPVHAKPVFTG